MLPKCNICPKQARQKCENCYKVRYCSILHREQDKGRHNANCFPVGIQKLTTFSKSGPVRNLIALRVIKPGEKLLNEKPLLRFPNSKKKEEIICLSCSSKVDGKYRCSKCNLPMCNNICEQQDDHIPECTLLKKHTGHLSAYISSSSYYTSIGVIRCIYQNRCLSERWKKLQNFTNPNIEPPEIQIDLADILRQLKEYYDISGYTMSDIKLVLLTILVNGIELNSPRKMGIYDILKRIPQCCSPNAFLSFNNTEYLVVQAAQNIEKGKTINVNYCYFYDGFVERNRHLSKKLAFTCHCIRCEDSTDLGTHHNSLVCVTCKVGLILPPTGTRIKWICNFCGRIEPKDIVMATLKKIEVEKDDLSSISEHECFLKYTTKLLLSENHHLRVQVKVNLLFLYLSKEWNKKKITCSEEIEDRGRELCRDILKFSQAVTRNGYHPEIGVIKKVLFRMLLYQVTKISRIVKGPSKERDALWKEILDISKYVRKVFRDDCLLPSERLGFDELNQMYENTFQMISEFAN